MDTSAARPLARPIQEGNNFMELSQIGIFLTVATEKSFSRAAQKLMRTQPAVSLAVQRLEAELGEKLLDRSLKDGTLTDAGKIVYGYALQFDNMRREMFNALTELRDKNAGKLTICSPRRRRRRSPSEYWRPRRRATPGRTTACRVPSSLRTAPS